MPIRLALFNFTPSYASPGNRNQLGFNFLASPAMSKLLYSQMTGQVILHYYLDIVNPKLDSVLHITLVSLCSVGTYVGVRKYKTCRQLV